jgi:diacylglycerol kinase family enzyme
MFCSLRIWVISILSCYLHEILLGTHRDVEDIEYFQTKSVRVVSDQRVSVEIDGEAALETPVQFELTRRIEVVA